MNSNNEAIVVVDELYKLFKSGGTVVPAVDGVSLRLPRGKMIAIKGESGSGKTTLLRTLSGQLAPLAGELRLAFGPGSALGHRNRADGA